MYNIGDVPLDIKIRLSCDNGSPIATSSLKDNNPIVSDSSS